MGATKCNLSHSICSWLQLEKQECTVWAPGGDMQAANLTSKHSSTGQPRQRAFDACTYSAAG